MSKTRNQIRDEMTGLLLRGGLIGLVAFAAAVAFMVVPTQIGRIWPTQFEQTGFRGTGMEVIQFRSDVVGLAEANVLPETIEAPVQPQPGEALAGDIYENVQVLGHLTDANFNRLMLAITEWVSPEQGCAYCHGEDGDFVSDDYYPKVVARNMIQMTWAINQDWDVHVAQTGVTCYTCHRGNNVPQNVWFSPEPLNNWAGPSARYQNQPAVMNYSTALPVDAMQVYLLESDQPVGVHGTTPRNPGVPGASIYHTYQTFSLMQHFSNALGVNCTYCHNTRALAEIDQATPQWATAQVGRAMVQDINNLHILPTQPLLPETRLGPLGDVSKVNCTTCHQGAAKPLLGQSMLGDWPELVSPEPVYQ
jgi:photosynthetic reaction center cytochrome c subunit